MTNLDFKEKLLGSINVKDKKMIVVSHVTVRQSIFFLVLKMLAVELFATVVVILIHTILFSSQFTDNFGEQISLFNIPLFILLVVIKSVFVIFIVVQWLNEYYEITGDEVVYRRGVIVKTENRYKHDHIGSVELEQGLLGGIFNYGTLKLFIWTTEKKVLMYLIHNPKKYQKILEELLPEVEKSKRTIREHVLEPEDDEL